MCERGWWKEGRVIHGRGGLGVGSIYGFGPCVVRMFVAMCWCMLEAFESFGDISRHVYVNGGVNIVPAQSHGEIEREPVQ
jgi:hypothetical protein